MYKGRVISDAIRTQSGEKHLLLTFEKTDKDNPIVNGIILYQGSIAGKKKNSIQKHQTQSNIFFKK